MNMKRRYILCFAILGSICAALPASAQDDDFTDDETTTTVDESKNVTWEIPFVKDNSGNTVLGSTLAINGTGAMADYTGYSTSGPDNFAPWIVPDHSHSF